MLVSPLRPGPGAKEAKAAWYTDHTAFNARNALGDSLLGRPNARASVAARLGDRDEADADLIAELPYGLTTPTDRATRAQEQDELRRQRLQSVDHELGTAF